MSDLNHVDFRPPKLECERVILRGWESSDAEAVFAYASDPEVAQFMSWDRHRTLGDARFFLDEIVAASYRAAELNYALCLRRDPSWVIGGVGAYPRSTQHGTFELGYVLAREYWGHGYMPEAGRRLLGHVFETTQAERIYAPIFAENDKSRRAAIKMGMTLDGVLRSSILVRGQRRDEAVHSILRSEWSQA